MALSYYQLLKDSQNIRKWIHNCNVEAEFWRQIEFGAAVKIQSWFRGVRLRCYLKLLNEKVIIIQKAWRGVLGRKEYLRKLKNEIRREELAYYNRKCTVLQKSFRGWFARRRIFNYSVWKMYFKEVGEKNEELRKKVNDYWKSDTNPKVIQNKRLLKILKFESKKKHYMLSTEEMPGVYQQDNQPELLKVEAWLKRMKPSVKGERIDRVTRFPFIKPPPPVKNLPPRPQGPFKDPLTIYSLKNRPALNLRMLDDFEESTRKAERDRLNEKGKWIHDKPFTTRGFLTCVKTDYSKLINTMHTKTSSIEKQKYIKKSDPELNISKKDFKVKPVPEPIESIYQRRYGEFSTTAR